MGSFVKYSTIRSVKKVRLISSIFKILTLEYAQPGQEKLLLLLLLVLLLLLLLITIFGVTILFQVCMDILNDLHINSDR